jgi:hypothetical protein
MASVWGEITPPECLSVDWVDFEEAPTLFVGIWFRRCADGVHPMELYFLIKFCYKYSL